ncbi:ferrochelatase hem15, partial [Ascosphaera pollenicola]
MAVFPSKRFRPSAEGFQPKTLSEKIGVWYRAHLARQPFFLFGLPFIAIMVAGSFFLTPAAAVRYERHDHKVQSLNEQEAMNLGINPDGKGGLKKNPRAREVGSEKEEYYRLMAKDLDNWEQKRVQRFKGEPDGPITASATLRHYQRRPASSDKTTRRLEKRFAQQQRMYSATAYAASSSSDISKTPSRSSSSSSASASSATKAPGTAVVFLNMGGPSTTDEVGDFLTRLFTDGDIIQFGYFQNFIGSMISRRRTPTIQKHYKEIGGGSPIRKWSEYQATEMCKILDKTSPATAPHKPYVAFRYAAPLTEETYNKLLEDGFGRGNGGRAIAFTQYPQYSTTTTGSSLNELWRLREELEGEEAKTNPEGAIQWTVIDRWPTHPGLVEAVAQNIEKGLATYPPEKRDKVTLVFSAHSLPMSVVNKGDPYPAEVAATVYAVMQRLGFSNRYCSSWQSAVGPSAWLGPQTYDTVQNYVKRGQTDILIIPIAFTSDHIETLFEIDREIIADAKNEGVKRVESLNGSPVFIEGLADLVKKHLESGEQCSRQFLLRCQNPTSEKSLPMKKFFA